MHGSRSVTNPTPLTILKSSLTIDEDGRNAVFAGKVDYKTLGGAGFASQRTATADKVWDMSGFTHLKVVMNAVGSDGTSLIWKIGR